MASRSSTRRRVVVLAASLALPALLVFGFGHRGQHMARNLLVPGAGLWEEHLWVGLAFTVGMVAATVAWVRWGADWTVAAVVGGAVVASALWAPGGHDAPAAASPFTPARAAHEFPLVVLVVGALSWMRSLTARVPLLRRLGARRPRRVRAVDHARAVAVAQAAGAAEEAAVPADMALLARRARRVGLAARFRVGGDPFRRDHAAARAALAMAGLLEPDGLTRFVADADRAALGVPCSEPGWVRPLDGTLVAIALSRAGHEPAATRWKAALAHEFGLRKGCRAGWWWSPLGLGAGSMPPWEHAVTTALARAEGWIGDDDWAALRAAALGASARGTAHPDDERTIAAARVWLRFVDDEQAARLLARPTVAHDPLAVALDCYASSIPVHEEVTAR